MKLKNNSIISIALFVILKIVFTISMIYTIVYFILYLVKDTAFSWVGILVGTIVLVIDIFIWAFNIYKINRNENNNIGNFSFDSDFDKCWANKAK